MSATYLKLGGLVLAIALGGLYVWTAERAKERAGLYRAQLDVAAETAAHNAELARFLRAQAEHTEALLAERERSRRALARETEALRQRLSDALREAPDEVKQCLPVRLPRAVRDGLYGATEGDPED